MIRVGLELPLDDFYVACSGGVDSMAVVDFLSRGKRKPRLAYMNHGTAHAMEAETWIRRYAEQNSLELTIGKLDRERQPRESPEEFWREERYRFLHSLQLPVITAHHLDDVVEQWIFSSLHGKPGLIPTTRGNVLRPFLLTKKAEMVAWCDRYQVPYLNDPSNDDLRYMRNRIRHKLIPEALQINPGLRKVVARLVKGAYESANA